MGLLCFQAARVSEERQFCYGPGRCTTTVGEIPVTSSEGQWSCWSEWGQCSGGQRSRDRACDAEAGAGGIAVCSGGRGHQEEPCGLSGWSECSEATGLQTRHGEAGDTQTRACSADSEARPVTEAGASLNMIVGAAVIGFMLGSIIAAGLVYYYFKVKKNGGLHPPNYISAKSQNLYVSLPMLEQSKHKHNMSSNYSEYSGTLRSNSGTMRSSKTGSSTYGAKPGDYETATIKRSHSRRDSSLINNSSIRADLDSDNLFT